MIKVLGTDIKTLVFRNILLLFLITDFVVKYFFSYERITIFYKYNVLIKLFFISFALFFLGLKFYNKKLLTPILILVLAYLVGQASLFSFFNKADVLFNGYYFLSSISSLVFLFFFFKYDDKAVLNTIVKGFIYFMVFNSLGVFLGHLLQIDLFETYLRGPNRYGFQGFLLYHSEAGYLYFLVLNVIYFNYKKNPSIKYGVFLLIVFCCSLLIGTKKAIMLSVIFAIFFLVENRNKILKKKTLYIVVPIILVISLFINNIVSLFLKQYYLFYEIYQDKGFVSSFLSFRDVLIRDKFFPFIENQWGVVNYFFGGPAFSRYRVELEVFDLFLFFGLAGFLAYYLILKTTLKQKSKTIYFIAFGLFLASLFSGNLLSSINVMITFFVIINYITLSSKN